MAGEAVGRGGSVPPEPERQNPQSEKQNPQSEKQNPQSERQNLLSKRRERRQHRSEGRFPLHRLLVLARPGEGAAAVAGYHRELFEKALEDHWREQVSGLLLVCSSYICHVVESCSSTIHLLIQDLASFQNQGHSALLQEIKVLVVAHDIPSRLFPDWYVAAGTSPPRCPPGSTQPQSAPELAAECLDLLLKLAASVQSSEDDSQETNESVHTIAPELLIPTETINSLVNAGECVSPEDFLRVYLSPSQPVLDSETVWPVPSHFSP
ncbi:testis-expressed protein 47 isoform X1 [Calypte anna]|nr:testis-expressed protein 47 isoform X1 [Calypte anna]